MKHILFLFAFLIAGVARGQLSDVAKIDATFLPRGNAEVGYYRLRALFNYPIRLKPGSFLVVGLDYSKIELSFSDQIDAFDIGAIEDFQLLDLNIGYTFEINDRWRFGARFSPGYSSNLVRKLSIEDVVFSGDVVFINDRRHDPTAKKPTRLIIGVSYAENRGISIPLPFISYYRKFHPKWSYNIGIPKTNLQYHLSERSRFKLIAELDGFTSNIQDGLLVNGDEVAETINMFILIGGLRYEYKLTGHIESYLNLANIFSGSAELRDSNNQSILSVDENNRYYIRVGIRLKI